MTSENKSPPNSAPDPKLLDVRFLEQEFKDRAMEDSVDGYWFFLKEVLGYKDLDENLHGDICEILTKGGQHKFLFLLPRGHLKSSCVTIGYPMWRALQDPNRTFAIFNETEDLPVEFLREIRDHFETNPIVKRHWGHLIPGRGERSVWKTDSLQLKRSIISRTPTFTAKSINESTAGRHPDCMILDDVISDRTVNSQAGIEKSLARFRELQALLEPPDPAKDKIKGTLIVIGTRWHWNDLYAHIIDTLPHRYLYMKRSAIEDGRVIFPQKFTRDILDEKREEMGEWVFSSQYMNEPVDADNATFTPSMIKACTWRGDREAFLDSVPTNVFMAIDPAWEGRDAWGIVVGCVDPAGKTRVLEAHRCKARPDDAISKVVGMVQKWKPIKVGFEAVAGQEWLRRNLQDQLFASKIRIPVTALSHHNRSKDLRIMGLVPEIQYGRLRIHERCTDLITELLQYPRGKYRDLSDATEMLTRIVSTPGLRMRKGDPAKIRGTGDYEMNQLERFTQTKRMSKWL